MDYFVVSQQRVTQYRPSKIQVKHCWYKQTHSQYRGRSYPWAFFGGGGGQKVFYFLCFGIKKHHFNIFTRRPYMSLFQYRKFEREAHSL